ncbi:MULTISPECIES: helix-turn-helix transcriptional regulator [Lysinibacillus]|uniref:helix-turn-helix domain-containing protein n=1 Tax=Lysinibacillus TaxID=400634 RepID=UPI0028AE51EB|nr:helix-turn-helix transcriptional regulator [Lysinibacillus capsici]
MSGFIHCNLRVLMAERGLNIQNVKDQTTLSRTTISNLYNNYVSGIQFDTLIQLCTLLKCTIGDLFTFVNVRVSFNDISTDCKVDLMSENHIKDPSKWDGGNYAYRAKSKFLINLTLKYEGELSVFDIEVDTAVHFNELKQIIFTNNLISDEFRLNLDNVKAPVYVIDYIEEQFDKFLSECIHDRFINIFDNVD